MEDLTKSELRDLEIGIDPNLAPEEKEVTINSSKDRDLCTIHSDIPVFVKWVLSVEESKILRSRVVEVDGEERVVSIKALIPKGIIKLKGSARKSDTDSNVVSYGPDLG